MAKKEEIHQYLIKTLENRVPDKAKLVEILMNTLCMEKGAVYRRLRGEVPFSFYEVACIAEKLDLSLNKLIADKSDLIDSFVLDITDVDFKKWYDYLSLINLAKKDPNSEFAASSNLLPATIYAKYESLYKFYIYKYMYLLGGTENRTSFNDFILPEELMQIYLSYYQDSKNFANTCFICDHAMIDNLITDLHYFSGIHLLSEDDIQQIKEDLFSFLDYFEEIALNGCFDETGNSVEIYISDVNLDATYAYMQIDNICVCLLRTFIINVVMARDKTSYEKIKDWIQALKRASTLISISGAVFRADFFEKQRKMVSELK